MRKPIVFLGILIFFCVSLSSSFAGGKRPEGHPSNGVAIGSLAPDFTLENMSGQKVSLSQLRGKVVVLNFWATWCPPCRMEMPSMEKLYKAFRNKDFEMLAVNVEENGRAAVASLQKKHPHSFPVLLDSKMEVQKMYQVFRFPETYIIDKNGIIVDKVVGAMDWFDQSAVDYFNELVGE